jgi:hypothetical protein
MPKGGIDPEVERIFRKALGHAARAELAELIHTEDELNDEQLALCVQLCAFVTAYTAIDVCNRKWPSDASVRGMAEYIANGGEIVKRTGLTTQDTYEYISRVALGFEAFEKVFPDLEKITRIPFLVGSNILATYRPRGKHWWELLDVIENALERAWVTDLNVLPALMLLARMPAPPAAADGQR